ncbi:MAG: hypothetical protein K0S23_3735 [Fluviicola sp.]|jgi:hypothetical protein|nr:hypothetical protein [Fluviicola sp.]
MEEGWLLSLFFLRIVFYKKKDLFQTNFFLSLNKKEVFV